MSELLLAVWKAALDFIEINETWLKPLSFIVSPILAGFAFWANQRTLRHLNKRNARSLALKRDARDAKKLADERNEVLRLKEAELIKKQSLIDKLQADIRNLTDGTNQL